MFVAAREDLEAFEHVYDEYADSILAYLARRTLDPEVVFDLMAETFAEAFDDIGSFRGSTDEEGRAWLYAIATHLLMRWRKRGEMERRKMSELGISTRDLGQEEFERIETLADLQRFKPVLDGAMRRLSDDQQRVLQLFASLRSAPTRRSRPSSAPATTQSATMRRERSANSRSWVTCPFASTIR
jgi:RNA polymerase sigma factor (sigma-70 family)